MTTRTVYVRMAELWIGSEGDDGATTAGLCSERAPPLFWLAFNLNHVSPRALAKWSSTDPDLTSISVSSCSFSLFHVAPRDFAKWSSTEPGGTKRLASAIIVQQALHVVGELLHSNFPNTNPMGWANQMETSPRRTYFLFYFIHFLDSDRGTCILNEGGYELLDVVLKCMTLCPIHRR